jgi:hypothetical protein
MQIDRATELRDLKLYGALRSIRNHPFGTGPKIGTVRLPNFKENNEGYTKTTPTRSDEEILEAMKELAKKHAENGTFHNADNEYLDLYKEYVSSVSPDREGILTNSLNEIFEKANLPKKEKDNTLGMSILQQTIKVMEQAKNNNKRWLDGEIKGANYNVGWMEGNELKCADFFDSNGELIGHYDQNGWDVFDTKSEQARRSEILAVYNEAFNSVYNAQEVSRPKSLTSGNSLDVVG